MIYNLGLLGDPVEHSLSPQIHTEFFKKTNLKGGYLCFQVKPSELSEQISHLRALKFRGVNLTIPHKENGLKLANISSPEAQRIGAANTLIFLDNHSIVAENTDWIGFLKSLPISVVENTRNATLIGAGGSAKAVLEAFLKLNIEKINLLIRNSESSKFKAESLKNACLGAKPTIDFQINFIDDLSSASSFLKTQLIVNATPLGMSGFAEEETPLPKEIFQKIEDKSCFFYDLIYNPAQTKFLNLAEAHEFNHQNGYKMLELQAAYAFSLWTGANIDDLVD